MRSFPRLAPLFSSVRRAGILAVLSVLCALTAPLAAPQAQGLSAQEKAQTCFACHGPEGRSATPEVPSIAGQPREFVVKQLHLFRDRTRNDGQMAPVTAALTDADIDALAAYFAQVAPGSPEHPADPAVTAAASPLLEDRHCAACHGEGLAGQTQAPRLAGQQRAYLAWQLRAYRDHERPDPDATMADAVKALSNKDIRTLADYISRLEAH